MIVRDARAKLNLYLRVTGRRTDGYHLLDSLIAFCDLADTISVASAGELTLRIDGPVSAALAGEPAEANLVLRAARALAGRAGIAPKAAIHLTKRIPVAAGLGGGSADAAATLLALVELWRVEMPQEELFDLAAPLGADVPMCLAGRSAQVSGVGDRVGPAVALPASGVLLVNPGEPLATPSVFAAYARAGASSSAPSPLSGPPPDVAALGAALAQRGNDLAVAARGLMPSIADVQRALAATSGCRIAQMSGSGATVFALYDDLAAARVAAARIGRDHPTWWSHAGILA
ncbi:MAG: 4-(cytidine 5'-diphospho)-2-C-methyl-D-erythritol kinase [Alphaproteobacteria bacterium]|nr:4-(cytidine 5'-diphospho)-2-C-methyl-D-erythritol kinase [Alphaproteobacteria bacterium]MCW5741961.1 4-(cytidine 5'-diphospho)-2-C-methyl-D-erythritol kinase [Alphaproteobacteria bacterium]